MMKHYYTTMGVAGESYNGVAAKGLKELI